MIRIFIGYDPREAVAYHVLSHSIHARATAPVSIAPLKLGELTEVFWREPVSLQSTEFSFSRFLTPYLCDFEGWAIFMDCDMLVLDDIAKLWALRDDRYAVMCVKHNHVPKEERKFLGAVQTKYEKKNWSSVMLMNCAKCTALTPDFVNSASGLELHRFQWLESDDLIGEVPMGGTTSSTMTKNYRCLRYPIFITPTEGHTSRHTIPAVMPPSGSVRKNACFMPKSRPFRSPHLNRRKANPWTSN